MNENKQYLTFLLSSQECAFDALKILEVTENVQITPLPLASRNVLGISNFRGDIIPVVDLSYMLFKQNGLRSNTTIVVGSQFGQIALQVDEVREMIVPEEITPSEEIGTNIDLDHFIGVVMTEKGMIRILDIESIIQTVNKRSLQVVTTK